MNFCNNSPILGYQSKLPVMKTHFQELMRLPAVRIAPLICLPMLLLALMIAFSPPACGPMMISLPATVSEAQIQQALDILPDSGGEVRLPPGIFEITQPLILNRSYQTLRGAGESTLLHLAAGANCPVIIMGEPADHPKRTVKYLRLADCFIDGNRREQQRELWRTKGEGSEIRNNGIVVQNVRNSWVENVTCARCRSGGLVTTRDVRHLVVSEFNAFDNQFDGLACYQTTESLFTGLYLHDNPGAGISLDLAFNHNVVSNAVLNANDLGIFMRASRQNHFFNVTIHRSHHFGVFMADTVERKAKGWGAAPETECADNAFTNLIASNCGGAAFRVNNITCTNNVIVRAVFSNNRQGGLSLAQPDLVIVQ